MTPLTKGKSMLMASVAPNAANRTFHSPGSPLPPRQTDMVRLGGLACCCRIFDRSSASP